MVTSTTMMPTVRSKNKVLAERAVEILKAENPATLRQLFYRLVSTGILRNAQSEYQRLGVLMTRLRESGAVPRRWIVDHVRATLKPSSWSGLADFAQSVRDAYRKDFWPDMPHYVEIFVEKDAVAGTIQPVTAEYDVPLRVCRGYCSVSFAGEIAEDWGQIKKPIFAYYLGDYDPSGLDLERDLREKLSRYSGVYFQWRRIGINPDDFENWDLVRLPIKHSDNRARAFLENQPLDCGAEIDALPPSELRSRVEQAILGHIDAGQWTRLQETEAIEQETVIAYADALAKLKLGSVSGEVSP